MITNLVLASALLISVGSLDPFTPAQFSSSPSRSSAPVRRAEVTVDTEALLRASLLSDTTVNLGASIFLEDTIVVPSGTTGLVIDGQGSIGPAYSVDGEELVRCFDIRGASEVTLLGITIEGCYAQGDSGGGLYVGPHAVVTVADTQISTCASDHKGGAVFVGGLGTLVLRGYSLFSNEAELGNDLYVDNPSVSTVVVGSPCVGGKFNGGNDGGLAMDCVGCTGPLPADTYGVWTCQVCASNTFSLPYATACNPSECPAGAETTAGLACACSDGYHLGAVSLACDASAPSPTPTGAPTRPPTQAPSEPPAPAPSLPPTPQPTVTSAPSTVTGAPSAPPIMRPSSLPTAQPTHRPTFYPSFQPTMSSIPSKNPSPPPTPEPTFSYRPTPTPSLHPSPEPTPKATPRPTTLPTPSFTPTKIPTPLPTGRPTSLPTPEPGFDTLLVAMVAVVALMGVIALYVCCFRTKRDPLNQRRASVGARGTAGVDFFSDTVGVEMKALDQGAALHVAEAASGSSREAKLKMALWLRDEVGMNPSRCGVVGPKLAAKGYEGPDDFQGMSRKDLDDELGDAILAGDLGMHPPELRKFMAAMDRILRPKATGNSHSLDTVDLDAYGHRAGGGEGGGEGGGAGGSFSQQSPQQQQGLRRTSSESGSSAGPAPRNHAAEVEAFLESADLLAVHELLQVAVAPTTLTVALLCDAETFSDRTLVSICGFNKLQVRRFRFQAHEVTRAALHAAPAHSACSGSYDLDVGVDAAEVGAFDGMGQLI